MLSFEVCMFLLICSCLVVDWSFSSCYWRHDCFLRHLNIPCNTDKIKYQKIIVVAFVYVKEHVYICYEFISELMNIL